MNDLDETLPEGVAHKVTRFQDDLVVEPLIGGEDDQAAAVEAALAADREAALRDVFAAAALGSIIVTDGTDATYAYASARKAYKYADAMLEARKQS